MNGTFRDFNLQIATRKAYMLREQHPDSIIFVIYDYETQQHDALTHEQLEELCTLDEAGNTFAFYIVSEL